MKHYAPRTARTRRPTPPRLPLFHAVPARARFDGWTPRRQAEFIGHLAETRSVTEAARRVSMARETAYRLRTRPWAEAFNAAWDVAMGRPARTGSDETSQAGVTIERKVTNAELLWRAETGLWQVRMDRGKFIGAWPKPDNPALFRLLARLDRAKPMPRPQAAEGAKVTPRKTGIECQPTAVQEWASGPAANPSRVIS